jgi:ATP-dependent Lon protease
MRESAQTAVAVVRTLAPQLGIDPELFTSSDLHIHVPAGATPKDGPSAGTAIVTALTSLFTNRPVSPDLAMTGEISLRGRVLPVGGIKEKVLAARRAGITRVLLPKDNARDLVDIPDSRLRGLEVVLVDTLPEVLHHAFGGDVLDAG